MPRPKIRLCSICDPFVLIVREDDSIGLFIGEPERGKIRRKDMSPMGDKVCLLGYQTFTIAVDGNYFTSGFTVSNGLLLYGRKWPIPFAAGW